MDQGRSAAAVDRTLERPTSDLPVLIPRPRLKAAHPLTGRHALLVGINYAPEPTGIAPYTTGMAEHLAQHAQSLTVLTGMPHYPHWTPDPTYRWVLRCEQHESGGNGWVGEPGDNRAELPTGLTVRRMRHYIPGTQNALKRATYEATFALNAACARIRNRPDLVIAVTPSLGGAVAGARLARRHGSKLLIVVQDLMAKAASQSGISGGGAAARATRPVERWALRQANLVALVSETFRAQLHEYGVSNRRISVLPNWTHISPADITREQARRDLGWPAAPFTVVHTGNIGLKQDLGNLVEAARRCVNDAGLRFVIVGDGSQRGAIEAHAASLSNLSFVDPLDDDQYPKSLAAADLLVVNERPGVGDMSLPSKLTSYLVAGRPVIAAVGSESATAQELARTGDAALLVPPGNPEAFAAGVRSLRDDPEGCAAMAEAGRRYAEAALGPETAQQRLDTLIEECLSLP